MCSSDTFKTYMQVGLQLKTTFGIWMIMLNNYKYWPDFIVKIICRRSPFREISLIVVFCDLERSWNPLCYSQSTKWAWTSLGNQIWKRTLSGPLTELTPELDILIKHLWYFPFMIRYQSNSLTTKKYGWPVLLTHPPTQKYLCFLGCIVLIIIIIS